MLMIRPAGPVEYKKTTWQVNGTWFFTPSGRPFIYYLEIGSAMGRLEVVLPDPWDEPSRQLLIRNVEVDPRCRGQGIAQTLMYNAIMLFGHLPMRLNVKEDNGPAVHIYKKFGFL